MELKAALFNNIDLVGYVGDIEKRKKSYRDMIGLRPEELEVIKLDTNENIVVTTEEGERQEVCIKDILKVYEKGILKFGSVVMLSKEC